MKPLQVLAVCLVLAVASSVKIDYYFDCGSPGYSGTIKSIDIDGVSTCTPECLLYFNHTYTGHITFTAHANSQTATNKVAVDYAGNLIPVHTTPSACGNGLHCPVVKGSEVIFTRTVTLDSGPIQRDPNLTSRS